MDRAAVESLREKPNFDGPSSAHGPEHSLEVELPFLQVVAPEAEIIPILVGNETDAEMAKRMAEALVPLLDDGTARDRFIGLHPSRRPLPLDSVLRTRSRRQTTPPGSGDCGATRRG